MSGEEASAMPEPGSFRVLTPLRTTTLAEHGGRPICGPSKHEMAFEPIDMHFRGKVGKVVKAAPYTRDRIGLRWMYELAMAVNVMADGTDLRKLPPEERLAAIGQLRISDMMYLSFWRLHIEGDGFEKEWTGEAPECAVCKERLPNVIKLDLAQLQVGVWDEIPTAVYRFRRPWYYMGDLVQTVTVEPPRLTHSIESMSTEDFGDTNERGVRWAAASIVKVDGREVIGLTVEDIQRRSEVTGRAMHPKDLEGISQAMDAVFGGPSVALPWRHLVEGAEGPEGCGEELHIPVEWTKVFS